jgi:hypothetical protein
MSTEHGLGSMTRSWIITQALLDRARQYRMQARSRRYVGPGYAAWRAELRQHAQRCEDLAAEERTTGFEALLTRIRTATTAATAPATITEAWQQRYRDF